LDRVKDEDMAQFHNILNSLSRCLENLRLKKCPELKDKGLLGLDLENPLILQFKNLAHLSLEDTSVTNLSFQKAFKDMRLKTFRWARPTSKHIVTFEDGISTLSSVDEGFRNSIRYLSISPPENCTYSDLNVFARRFYNLKRFEVVKEKESENNDSDSD